MKFKLIALLSVIFSIGHAQPQILDKVIAVIGKNPLLLSEVETNLLQEKEKGSVKTSLLYLIQFKELSHFHC